MWFAVGHIVMGKASYSFVVLSAVFAKHKIAKRGKSKNNYRKTIKKTHKNLA